MKGTDLAKTIDCPVNGIYRTARLLGYSNSNGYTEQQCEEIKKHSVLYQKKQGGCTIPEIAKKHGVTRQYVFSVCKKKNIISVGANEKRTNVLTPEQIKKLEAWL